MSRRTLQKNYSLKTLCQEAPKLFSTELRKAEWAVGNTFTNCVFLLWGAIISFWLEYVATAAQSMLLLL